MSNNKSPWTFWLVDEDADRLERLSDRLNISPSKVVRAALKLYEDGLDAVDEGMRRINSISMEVVVDE